MSAIFFAASFLVSSPAPIAALIFFMTALLFNLPLAGCFFDICAFFVSFASTLEITPTSKAVAAITPNVCIFILCFFVSLVLTLLSRIRVIRSINEPPLAAKLLTGLEILICSNWANVSASTLRLGTACKDASSQQYSLSICICRDNHQTTG